MIVNNVDLNKISKTIEDGKEGKSSLKKPVKMHGEWILDSSKGYQFKTELSYEKGKQTIEIDSPSFLGGGGNRLGPMSYCVAGITSCFIGTFAAVASNLGVNLTELSVDAQCNVNFAKVLDMADEPIMNGIDFDIVVKSNNADRTKLDSILKMALERCPAMYSMSHVIPVNAKLR